MDLLVAAVPTAPAKFWSVNFLVFTMDLVSYKKWRKWYAWGNVDAVVRNLG